MRGVYRDLVGRLEGKSNLEDTGVHWEDNIKMDLHKVRGGVKEWIDSAQDRERWRAVVNAVMNLRVP
jgi:hypothetical protein